MKKLLLSFLLLQTIYFVNAQHHEIRYVCPQNSTINVKMLFDSLQVPLLFYDNKIYALSSECISRDAWGKSNDRNAGGKANDRNAGGNSNDRNAGGKANDRNAGGNSNDRNAGGKANDRNAGGKANDRNAGGKANERDAGGKANERDAGGKANEREAVGKALSRNVGVGANERDAAGGIGNFTCGLDSHGSLLLYFSNIKVNKNLKIFFNNSYFTSKNKFFKLKRI